MTAGEVWDDYIVRIEYEANGETLTKEEKIVLKGGENTELTFDTTEQRLAAR